MESTSKSGKRSPLSIELPPPPKTPPYRSQRFFQPATPIESLYTPTPPSTEKTKTSWPSTEEHDSIHVRDAFISSELDKMPPLPPSLQKEDPYQQVTKKLANLLRIYLKTEQAFDEGYKKNRSAAFKAELRDQLREINVQLIRLLNQLYCRIYSRNEASLIFHFVINIIARQPNDRLHEKIFDVLKRIGVSINDPLNSSDETLLHINIQQGGMFFFKSLLRNGASLTTKTVDGKTPINYLSQYNQNEMREYLVLFQKTQAGLRETAIVETKESESDASNPSAASHGYALEI